MSEPRVPVESAFQVTDPLGLPERLAILEVAFLVVAADREIHEQEALALEHVAAKLWTKSDDAPLGAAELRQLVDRFANARQRQGQDARLEAVAAALPRPTTRALAYKVACAMAMSDLDVHDREFELDLSLIAALGLPQQTADDLAAEVHEALANLSRSG